MEITLNGLVNLLFLFLIALTGCVSLGHNQRSIRQARNEEIENALRLANQVKEKRLLAKDMVTILEYRRK